MDATIPHVNGPLPIHRQGNKVTLITGGGGKIGAETAHRLLREGGKVALVDHDLKSLTSTVNFIKETLSTGQSVQSRILTIVADVTVEKEVQSYVKRTITAFGRLDCVFLNVGVSYEATSLFETREEDFEKVMRVNVKSAFLGIKHAAAAMRTLGNGGSIILTSHIAGLEGSPGLIAFSSSKFALRGLALTAADELGQYGIRVNTIHPSRIDTPSQSPEELEELKNAMPLGRLAQVDDVASVVAFLASEDSKFVSGGFLKIDGGSVKF